jgi:hypothetical protein
MKLIRFTALVTASFVAVALSPDSQAKVGTQDFENENGIVAVKIPANQKGAYPLQGLASASIVYVELVERGFTRHIAFYPKNKLPQIVGPVRSLRETDFDVLDQFGKVDIYVSGRSLEREYMLSQLAKTKHTIYVGEGLHQRPTGCEDPFCDFLEGSKVSSGYSGPGLTNRQILEKAGLEGGSIPLKIKKKGVPIKGLKIEYEKTPYSEWIPRSIRWDSKKRVWIYSASGRSSTLESINGKKTKGNTSSTTAIIQFTSAKNAGNGYTCRPMPEGGPVAVPFTNTVGKGRGLLLRDEKMYDITWSRSKSTESTKYKFLDGSPATISGQPWVFLVPTNLTKTNVSYTNGKKALLTPKPPSPNWNFSTNVLSERKKCEATSQISVKSLGNGSSVITVKSSFDSLLAKPVKKVKLKIKLVGKSEKTFVTNSEGEVMIKSSIKNISYVEIAKQKITGQTFKANRWTKVANVKGAEIQMSAVNVN